MSAPARRRFEYATAFGIPAAIVIVLAAQVLEGAPTRALWQPTAALVVFGGTFAALCVSYPSDLIRRTFRAIKETFVNRDEPIDEVLTQILHYAHIVRRKGLLALESEIDRTGDPFLQAALATAVEGTPAKVARQILEVEHDALREHAEAPADVLETAAGYAPTLGILGAVLGLIHVMQSLGEPSKLGSGIAVAFVATVYGVGSANLILLPLATKLRTLAREAALRRELVIEGMSALHDGMNPRLIEQQLKGFLVLARESGLKPAAGRDGNARRVA